MRLSVCEAHARICWIPWVPRDSRSGAMSRESDPTQPRHLRSWLPLFWLRTPPKNLVFYNKKPDLFKPVFHQKWGLGIFLTLGIKRNRKIDPAMLNMSPWGLTATHFVNKLSDRAKKNTKLYTRPPSKKTSKTHQIYYRILLLTSGSNF